MELLLEYAYDTATRLAHGMWRQDHPTDAIEFPYAVLKVGGRVHAAARGLGVYVGSWVWLVLECGVELLFPYAVKNSLKVGRGRCGPGFGGLMPLAGE